MARPISRYAQRASDPIGNVQLRVEGLHFKSLAHEWLMVSGPKAQLKGSGWVNDVAGYEFLLTVHDGADDVDHFRIRIWKEVSRQVVYDSQPGDDIHANAVTAISGGNITIRK